jgi:hypothetical protein
MLNDVKLPPRQIGPPPPDEVVRQGYLDGTNNPDRPPLRRRVGIAFRNLAAQIHATPRRPVEPHTVAEKDREQLAHNERVLIEPQERKDVEIEGDAIDHSPTTFSLPTNYLIAALAGFVALMGLITFWVLVS